MIAEQSKRQTDAELHRQWQTDGYVLVRGLFDTNEVARLREICDHARRGWSRCDAVPGEGTDNDEAVEMRHVNHPNYFRDRPDLLKTCLEACADHRLLGIARDVFGEKPEFYSTTYSFNPRGRSRNGNWHRDTQFVTKSEEEEKEMLFANPEMGLQLQLALVASDDTEVVPGSHLRWDTDAEYAIRKSDGGKNAESDSMPGALRVALNPGDIVAFNASALHRGRYHTDKMRRTLMLTYLRSTSTPQDTYFSHQPWTTEPDYLTGVTPHAREFFERFIRRYDSFWNLTAKEVTA